MKKTIYHLMCILTLLVGTAAFTSCEIEDDDSDYIRHTAVGYWEVQESFINSGSVLPYYPGTLFTLGGTGGFSAYLTNGDREIGNWSYDYNRSNHRLLINIRLNDGSYVYLDAYVITISDNYMRLQVEDHAYNSVYTLILIRSR